MIRKILLFSILAIVLAFTFTKCKKASTDQQSSPNQDQTALKINKWIDAQIKNADSSSKSRMISLKSNLDLASSYSEDYAKGQSFLIVPILSGYNSRNNVDKKPASVLLLFVTDTGIRKGNIVQHYDGDSKTTLSKGVFTSVFNSKIPTYSGTLSFSSLSDVRLYDVSYKNGKMASYSLPKSKQQGGRNARDEQCTEWYLVTYFPDGTEDWHYLFTSCGDDCNIERVANNVALKTECGGNGNGGSGGGGENGDCCLPDANIQIDWETPSEPASVTYGPETTNADGSQVKTNVYTWKVHAAHLLFYSWYYLSYETGTLNNTDGHWKFVSLTHTAVQRNGTTPPCMSFDFLIGASNVVYGANNYSATMQLWFTETGTINCIPGVPNSGSTGEPGYNEKTFHAE